MDTAVRFSLHRGYPPCTMPFGPPGSVFLLIL